jgi:hypothetical protein
MSTNLLDAIDLLGSGIRRRTPVFPAVGDARVRAFAAFGCKACPRAVAALHVRRAPHRAAAARATGCVVDRIFRSDLSGTATSQFKVTHSEPSCARSPDPQMTGTSVCRRPPRPGVRGTAPKRCSARETRARPELSDRFRVPHVPAMRGRLPDDVRTADTQGALSTQRALSPGAASVREAPDTGPCRTSDRCALPTASARRGRRHDMANVYCFDAAVAHRQDHELLSAGADLDGEGMTFDEASVVAIATDHLVAARRQNSRHVPDRRTGPRPCTAVDQRTVVALPTGGQPGALPAGVPGWMAAQPHNASVRLAARNAVRFDMSAPFSPAPDGATTCRACHDSRINVYSVGPGSCDGSARGDTVVRRAFGEMQERAWYKSRLPGTPADPGSLTTSAQSSGGTARPRPRARQFLGGARNLGS